MADVARLAGVMVSEDAARELIAVIDELAKRAAPTGQYLSTRVATIRRELATCVSGRCTPADASPEGVMAQQVAQFEVSVVDTTTAARELGNITRSGVTWLCRHGRLRATRTGGRWLIESASLQEYRARRGHTKEA
jgi:hypothetical protein